jgi:hypothetical protein
VRNQTYFYLSGRDPTGEEHEEEVLQKKKFRLRRPNDMLRDLQQEY